MNKKKRRSVQRKKENESFFFSLSMMNGGIYAFICAAVCAPYINAFVLKMPQRLFHTGITLWFFFFFFSIVLMKNYYEMIYIFKRSVKCIFAHILGMNILIHFQYQINSNYAKEKILISKKKKKYIWNSEKRLEEYKRLRGLNISLEVDGILVMTECRQWTIHSKIWMIFFFYMNFVRKMPTSATLLQQLINVCGT